MRLTLNDIRNRLSGNVLTFLPKVKPQPIVTRAQYEEDQILQRQETILDDMERSLVTIKANMDDAIAEGASEEEMRLVRGVVRDTEETLRKWGRLQPQNGASA